jgi:hypothetical protein
MVSLLYANARNRSQPRNDRTVSFDVTGAPLWAGPFGELVCRRRDWQGGGEHLTMREKLAHNAALASTVGFGSFGVRWSRSRPLVQLPAIAVFLLALARGSYRADRLRIAR